MSEQSPDPFELDILEAERRKGEVGDERERLDRRFDLITSHANAGESPEVADIQDKDARLAAEQARLEGEIRQAETVQNPDGSRMAFPPGTDGLGPRGEVLDPDEEEREAA